MCLAYALKQTKVTETKSRNIAEKSMRSNEVDKFQHYEMEFLQKLSISQTCLTQSGEKNGYEFQKEQKYAQRQLAKKRCYQQSNRNLPQLEVVHSKPA